MERRTRAPAPSDCSRARKDFAIARGAEVVRGSFGGMTGRPLKFADVVDMLFFAVMLEILVAALGILMCFEI